jgi:diguanylate cyclase (GGDEF)-like protein
VSGTVLLIHNDQERRRLVHAQLEPRGHTVIDGAYGAMTHNLTVTTRPDLVVVDSEIAGSLPAGFLDAMHTDVRISDVPVIVANTSRITDLVVDIEVQLQIGRLRAEHHLEDAIQTDPVTGLNSPSHMKTELTQLCAIAYRYEQPLSVVLVGLDRFERTNRLFGEQAGDEVLRDVGERFATDVRDSDIVGRWQGDQFMALLPCTSKAGARFLAERFRETLAESNHKLSDGNAIPITASFGCSDVDDGDPLVAATEALHEAKRAGRNTVALAH